MRSVQFGCCQVEIGKNNHLGVYFSSVESSGGSDLSDSMNQ